MRSRHVARIAGWAAAGVVVAGAAGVGIAQAAGGPSPEVSASPTSSASPSPRGPEARRPHQGRVRGPLGRRLAVRRLMHGEGVVAGRGGKPTTVDVQWGTVTSVSGSSITLRSKDGFTATYAITSSTRVRINERGATAAQIADGDTAVVTATRSGDTRTAKVVVVRQ